MITGAASGIGAAVARKFSEQGAAGIVLADTQLEGIQEVAETIGSHAMPVRCDVTVEQDIRAAVQAAEQRFGAVGVYVSNAGVLGPLGGIEIDDSVWQQLWAIHAMAHVWAARAVLPSMLRQGEGYVVVTASAAGLLNVVESAPYGVTKHAAVGFAEWLRIAYGRRGIRVSCLCPQSVKTPMIGAGGLSGDTDGLMTPEQVADALEATIRSETFLCLPHPEVADYHRRKGEDYDRWLGGMQKIYARQVATGEEE